MLNKLQFSEIPQEGNTLKFWKSKSGEFEIQEEYHYETGHDNPYIVYSVYCNPNFKELDELINVGTPGILINDHFETFGLAEEFLNKWCEEVLNLFKKEELI